MSTFQRCPKEVNELANEILCAFETHKPLLDAHVTVDYVFAFADIDEQTNQPVGNALTHNGTRALGLCRKIALKDRALGRADAEISLDGQWWEAASEAERRALLDHELHHIAVKTDKRGLVRDDLGRPVIQLRKHDYEFGWFKAIAARHGRASIERQQAAEMMCDSGQYFWPDFAGDLANATPAKESNISSITISGGGESVTIDPESAKKIISTADALLQDEDEEVIQQCIECIRSEQKASVSLIQRRFRLGYTRAARIMDELERRNIVGPAKGAEPRDILIELPAAAHA